MEKQELYSADLTSATWRTSSFTVNNNQCVEVADLPGGAVALRDSKNPGRDDLRFTREEWVAFVNGVHAREFD